MPNDSPRTGETVTIRQTGRVPVTTYVDAWSWRCNRCGWVGLDLYSENAAEREAAAHEQECHPS